MKKTFAVLPFVILFSATCLSAHDFGMVGGEEKITHVFWFFEQRRQFAHHTKDFFLLSVNCGAVSSGRLGAWKR